jgi:hypothetical protein
MLQTIKSYQESQLTSNHTYLTQLDQSEQAFKDTATSVSGLFSQLEEKLSTDLCEHASPSQTYLLNYCQNEVRDFHELAELSL